MSKLPGCHHASGTNSIVVAAGMRGQVKPGLSHIGYLRHVVDMQPSELLQCARDRVERARILFVLAATHITDAPFPAGGMGGRRKAGRDKGDAGAQGRDRGGAGCRRDGPREARSRASGASIPGRRVMGDEWR